MHSKLQGNVHCMIVVSINSLRTNNVVNSERFFVSWWNLKEVKTDHLSGIFQCFVLTCVSPGDRRPFLFPSGMYRTLSSKDFLSCRQRFARDSGRK